METTKLSDEWQTPEWLFDELNKEFNFGIDLCATKENSKCERYCTDYLQSTVWQYLPKVSCINAVSHVSGLELQYNRSCIDSNSAAFMNPPYSNPKPFIQKAWEDSKHCKIVCLVKCDPSTRWWATFWNYETQTKTIMVNEPDFGIGREVKIIHIKPGSKPGCDVRFFQKRIKFDPPRQLINSGEVRYLESDCRRGTKSGKWVHKCKKGWVLDGKCLEAGWTTDNPITCKKCKGKGYTELSGPTFPCALIIMDRRGML